MTTCHDSGCAQGFDELRAISTQGSTIPRMDSERKGRQSVCLSVGRSVDQLVRV